MGVFLYRLFKGKMRLLNGMKGEKIEYTYILLILFTYSLYLFACLLFIRVFC